MTTDSYQAKAEAFLAALNEERYRGAAGLSATVNTPDLYERYRSLFDPVLVRELIADRGDLERRLIAEFAAMGYLELHVQQINNRISDAVSNARVLWEGRDVPFRQASVLLAHEADIDRRHQLERLLARATTQSNGLREQRWDRLHEAADALGFPTYRDLCDELRGLKLAELERHVSAVLSATDDHYLLLLDRQLHGLGLPPADATPADIAYLVRGRSYDSYLPGADMVPAFGRTMQALGFKLEQYRGLKIDLEPRPRKSPRSVCAPVRVPNDVRLVVLPKGGLDDYRSFFYEAGLAAHFINVRGNLPFAFRCLGDASLTKTYASLFESLVRDPHWLRRMLVDMPSASYFGLLEFARLHRFRCYGAKLRYELELHSGAPRSEMPGRYVEQLRSVLVHRIFDEDYLANVDDGFQVAQDLRSWIVEAQIRQFLIREFSEDWSADRRSGEFLYYLWERGQQVAIEDIVREIGYEGLDPGPLIAELLTSG